VDTSALFDPASAAGSAVAGFAATLIATLFKTFLGMAQERQTMLLSALKIRTRLYDASADRASKRDAEAGRWLRRAIYFGCAFTIIVAPFLFAFFPDIPVEVESREVIGGWLWGLLPEWTSVDYHCVRGFYLPDSIQTAFVSYLIPFYLGRGAAR